MMQRSQIMMKRQIRKWKRTKTTSIPATTTLLPCLPNEIMFFHILPKVPAICLLKLNCVSKLWYNTIHDPKFIATYLSHGKSNPSLVALLRLHTFLCYLHLEEAEGAAVLGHHHASVGLRLESHFPIIGHCNGLTCNRCPSFIQISNPSTRELLTFPQPSLSPLTERLCNNLALHGFGCDPVLNEYKVIQICLNYSGYYDIWVYTLGTSSWRNITATCNYPPSGYPACLLPVCTSGALYWMNNEYGKILSFDLHLENFQLVPCPKVFPAPGLIYHGLFDLEGCLSLLFGRNDNLIKDGVQLIIYRLRVVPTEQQQQAGSSSRSWIRVGNCICLPFKPDTKTIQIVAVSKQLYLQWNTKDGDFILYNVNKMIIQNKFSGLGLSEEVELVNHVENLLSLKTFVPVPSAGDFKVKYASSPNMKGQQQQPLVLVINWVNNGKTSAEEVSLIGFQLCSRLDFFLFLFYSWFMYYM